MQIVSVTTCTFQGHRTSQSDKIVLATASSNYSIQKCDEITGLLRNRSIQCNYVHGQ